MIFPEKLRKGDRVALIATSGPVSSEKLVSAEQSLRILGLDVLIGESCRKCKGYLAGTDDVRAADVDRMFSDKSIKGIFVIRGGYGSQRILDKINYENIRRNPKIFAGYSDVTALHLAINKKCGLVTYHAPMAATELNRPADPYTSECFYRALFGDALYLKNPLGVKIKTLVRGKARGQLTGGNLTLVSSSVGTEYEIDAKGKILFLEEVGEAPYRIDRMLLQLKRRGILRDCAGIILGYFTDCKPDGSSLTLMEVFNDLIISENKPVICNLACGHSLPTMTLPMGGVLTLDADRGCIK